MTPKSRTKIGRLLWLSLMLVAVAVAISACSQLRQVLPGASVQPTGTAVASRPAAATPAATGAASSAPRATAALPAAPKAATTPQAAPKAAATQPAAAQAQPTAAAKAQATAVPQAQPTGAAGAAGGAAGGAGGAQQPSGGAGGLEGQLWKLTAFANAQGALTNVPANTRTTLEFNNGQVSGNAGCNNYFGSYSVNGNQIMISEVAATMKACAQPIMTLEQAYFKALQAAATFKITGDTLELMNNAGKTTLKYQVSQPVSLTTTRWVAIGYNNGKNAVQSVAAGTEITAIFGTDGKLTGSAGCNSYNAGYQTTGTNIQIEPPASTKKACAQAVMAQEAAYLAALPNASTYTIRDDTLELRDATGALLADYKASK
ncbi:MAG: META domain-containing protein [Anaerolineae bacterium]